MGNLSNRVIAAYLANELWSAQPYSAQGSVQTWNSLNLQQRLQLALGYDGLLRQLNIDERREWRDVLNRLNERFGAERGADMLMDATQMRDGETASPPIHEVRLKLGEHLYSPATPVRLSDDTLQELRSVLELLKAKKLNDPTPH